MNVRTQEFRNFLREKGAAAGCAACEKPCGRYHTPDCQGRKREWEEAHKRCAEERQQELPMKRRLESQERPEKHEREQEEEFAKEVKRARTQGVGEKGERGEGDLDGGASDAKAMKETTREMEKMFEKVESEETERGIVRGYEMEFGDEDLEEHLARMRSIPASTEEMCLVTKAGPTRYDAIPGEELPQELVDKGMQAERESLGSFPVEGGAGVRGRGARGPAHSEQVGAHTEVFRPCESQAGGPAIQLRGVDGCIRGDPYVRGT